MLSDGRPVEPILLSNSLRTSGVLQTCGGQDYIDDLHNDVFQIADAVSRVEFYIETVKRESVRRTLLNLTRKWVQTLKTSNPDEVLDSIQSDILNSLHPEGRSTPSRVFDIATYVSKMIDTQSEGNYVSPAIATGIHKLDDSLGGGFYLIFIFKMKINIIGLWGQLDAVGPLLICLT